jgi:hypothetical protein
MVALASSISLGLGIDRLVAKEKFTSLTGDNLKNRDKESTPLVGEYDLPLSTDNLF